MWLTILITVAYAVVELTADSHKKFLEANENALVLYYVPWCHWCRRFLPMFEEIAAAAETAFQPISQTGMPKFAKINLDDKKHHPLRDAEGVMSYPTLKLHQQRGNSSVVYSGDHHFQSVLTWLLERTTSKLEIESIPQLNALLQLHHSDVVCVLVNPTPPMEVAYNMASKVQEHVMFGTARGDDLAKYILRKFSGAHVTDDEQRAKWLNEHLSSSFIALFNPHYLADDPDRFTYDQSHREYLAHLFPEEAGQDAQLLNSTAIEEFVVSYQFPAVSRWSLEIGQKLVEAGRPFLIAFRHLDDTIEEQLANPDFESTDALLVHTETILWEIGRKWRNKFATILSGTDHFYERRIMTTLGVEKGPTLLYVTLNPTGSGVFSPTLKFFAPEAVREKVFSLSPELADRATSIAAAELEAWIRNIRAGKVRPDIKSEDPLPEDINEGPVRHLVARTFTDDVILNNQDVLVDFFAPWCGHCRVLAPIYEKVAKAFKQANVNTIRMAKIDATANELGGIHLIGYPTLILYPWNSKDRPVIHHGGLQDGESLIQFLATKVAHKFDINKVLYAFRHPREDDDLPRLAGEL